jgi:hypothetical protein
MQPEPQPPAVPGDAAPPAQRRRPMPPEHTRFKPGQSGNPGGRPKGRSITASLRKLLEQEHNGKPLAELMAERMVKEALSGKFPFLKEVLERTDGKVKELHELKTKEDLVLYIEPPRVIGEAERVPKGTKAIGGIDPQAI